MIETSLSNLFNQYKIAFDAYDLNKIQQCYQLPCTLQSGQQVVHISEQDAFSREFLDILTILQHAKVTELLAMQASYQLISADIVMCVIDWRFNDDQGEVFTEFTGVYHVKMSTVNNTDVLNIFNIVSHELTQSITLPNTLTVSDINRSHKIEKIR